MKKYYSILFLLFFSFVYANEKLPNINKNDNFIKILSKRKTSRDFTNKKEIDNQTLSNILWVAWGFNRDNKRVIPTALNKQDIEIYVIKKNGSYLYSAENNSLIEITKENLFPLFTQSQNFVNNASIILLYTSKEYNEHWSQMHIGSSYQNVAIYCAEHNIKNVVKGSFDDKKTLAKKLKLKEKNIVITQIIGY